MKDISTMQNRRSLSRRSILKGTIILTLAGFITRVLGFFYKIFLSKAMGTEWLGIYQLVFPIYGIAFTIYATGIQTSISRLVAAEMAKRNPKNAYKILRMGLILSVSLALMLSLITYLYADWLAARFLLEARSAPSIKILAIVFPFCGVTSCINGYYYGLKKTAVPAITQLLEQIVRVIVVYIFAVYYGDGNLSVTCEMAVIGLVIGEIFSSVYNFVSIFITKSPTTLLVYGPDPNAKASRRRKILKDLLQMSVPLSSNRLFINILHSMEAVLIPTMLRRFGMTTSDALSYYGILIGMSIPFILFPTAVINALSVLLLPTISEAQAVNNHRLIGSTTSIAIKYTLIIGIMSTGVFLAFGQQLGNSIFHNETAGEYLRIMAWLCPLIYLATTLGSVINGLGKTHITFINSVIGSLSKIALITVLIPRFGITGYLMALLVGQLIITILDALAIIRNISCPFDAINSILKPSIIVAISAYLSYQLYQIAEKITQINEAVIVLSFCLLFCVISLILLMITKTMSKTDFK